MTADAFLASEVQLPVGLQKRDVESFLDYLRATGYGEEPLGRRCAVAELFAEWTRQEQLTLSDLNDSHMIGFVTRSPREPRSRPRFERAVLHRLLRHLRTEAGMPSSVESLKGGIHRQYVDYLRDERGLSQNSINVYSPYVLDFVAAVESRTGSTSLGGLDAAVVQHFLLDRVRDRSSEYSRLLASTLRSFLRFLYLRGETTIDLSVSVPTVRRWRQATVPAFLSSEQVERILGGVDRSTPGGRRDYAILLLLARLGLRPGEVVTLELGDIRWRTAEIVIRGKGRVLSQLPLLSDVGEALALYVRKDRFRGPSRRVFVRMIPPRIGLTGPAAIGHIVRRAFALAGFRPASRGAAHLFRHSLATRMIRHGASISEISEVLRHRSQNTTQIYAKVDFEALRGVARPWPGTGGAR